MEATRVKKDKLLSAGRWMVFLASVLFTTIVYGNPVLNNIAAGQVSVQQSPNVTNINQTSQKAILNWNSFNINKGEATHFNQPQGGIALNRINANQGASQIYGVLTATGKIILINSAGIFFGPSAYVNVGGLIASTAQLSNRDFLNNQLHFNHSGPGSIVNEGHLIAANHGLIALIGDNISNNGLIEANLGHVVLATGDAFTISFAGNDMVNFTVDQKAKQDGKISNTGKIVANGGTVLVTADAASNVLDNTINMGGVVEAKSVGTKNGQIILSANNGTVKVSGKLIATGKKGQETGGTVKVLGNQVALLDNAQIDTSGNMGGGEVLIGGNAHGAGPEQNASYTYVSPTASIKADALQQGNGGKVVVWSNDGTQYYGSISAQGGSKGGNGGWVEVSGSNLNFDGTVNTHAPHGSLGTLLLDPMFLIVQTSGGSSYSSGSNNLFANNPTGTNTITPASIASAAANITLQANSDVIFNTALSMTTSGDTLTVDAGRSIIINASVSTTNGAITMEANDNAATSADRSTTSTGNPSGDNETVNGNITLASGVTVSSGTATTSLSIGSTNTAPYSPGSITQAATGGISAGSVTLSVPTGSSGSIGTLSLPMLTTSTGTLTLTSGTGGAFVTNTGNLTLATPTLSTNNPLQVTSSGTLTLPSGAIATGTGNLTLESLGGALTTASNLSSTTGNILLSATKALTIGTSDLVSSTSGTIDLLTNQGGTGANSFTMSSGSSISTGNTGSSAVVIDVNTASGGTGGAALSNITTGSGGTLTVATNNGSNTTGGSITQLASTALNVGTAGTINLSVPSSGTKGIGTSAANILTTSAGGILNITSGTGGVFVANTGNLTLNTPTLGTNTGLQVTSSGTLTLPSGAISTGTGALTLESLGGSLTTVGTLTSSTGEITLSATKGLTIGNTVTATGKGVIDILANQGGTGANNFVMNSGTSISTANTSATAVTIDVNTASGGTGSAALSNITTGSGGTLTVATNNGGNTTGGSITQLASTALNVGTAGAINLAVPSSGSSGIGTSGANILTTSAGGTLTLTAGSGGAYVANTGNLTLAAPTLNANSPLQVTSSGTLTLPSSAIATGTGNLTLKSLGGSLATANSLSSTTGSILLSATTALSLVASDSVSSTSGTIDLLANQGGTGANGFTMNTGSSISTGNTTANAVNIAVNTAGGGTGTATVLGVSTGSGGTVTVNANGGSISDSGASIMNVGTGNIFETSANTITLASGYQLLSTGLIQLTANTLTFNTSATPSQIGGTGTGAGSAADVILLNSSANETIGIAGGTGTLQLTAAALNDVRTINLRIGGSTTGNINLGAFTPAATTATNGVLTLDSGTGSITQSGALNLATDNAQLLLRGVSATLTSNNVLTNFAASLSGALSFTNTAATMVASLTDDIGTVNGITTPGNVTLTSSNTIGESGSALINGALLTTSSVGGTTLNNANTISSFNATNTSSGNVALTNTGALSITGVSQTVGNLTIANTGAISQTGAITVSGTSSFSAGANSINLLTNGGSNSFTGAVSLSNSGANAVSLNNNRALILAASSVGQNLTITANGAISQTGALTVPGTSSFSAGANSINLLTNGGSNDFTGAVTLSNIGANAVSLNNNRALILAASSVGQNLTITANGAISQTGALTVPGTSSFSAGANSINLLTNGGSNDFTGAVTLSNSGANNVSLINSIALALGTSSVGSGTLSLTSGGSITETGAITQAASAGTVTIASTAASSDVILNTQANNFSGAITFSGTLADIRDVDLRNTNSSAALPTNLASLTNLRNLAIQFDNAAIVFPTLTLTNGGNLSAIAGGAISQTGALTVPGTASFSAGANTINLSTNGSSNDFTGAVSLSNSGTNNVSLTNSIALGLGTSSVGSGTLSLTSGGSITETGAITQAASAGTVTIASTAVTSDVILNTQANNFSGAITFGGTLTNFRDIDLRNTNASATLPTNLASLTNLRNLAIQFDNAAITFPALTLTNGGSLSAIAGGAISQTGALTVPGTSSFNAGANTINLLTNGSSNDFTGAVTLSNSGSNAVSLNNNAALILAASTVGQNLTITANGAISQTGALTVPGTSSFSAGANSINLLTSGSSNDFTGAVTLSNSGANNVSLNNNAALVLAASTVGQNLTVTANGAISQTGALTVPGTSSFSAGANTINLLTNGSSNDFTGTVALSNSGANNVSLNNNAALVLAASTVGQNLAITANGAISQTGALTVPGTSSFSAGANTINLLTNGSSNDFTGAVTLSNSGANNVSLNNNAALVLAASTVGQNLTITANGAISQTGALTVPGTSSFSAGANSINLLTNGSSNDFTGAVTLSNSGANNVSLNNNAALILAASTVGQNLTITASGAISQTSALTIPGTSSFSAGANSINLLTNGSSNDFVGAVTLSNSGTNAVSLNNNAALILAASTVGQNLMITANGAISQTGALTVPGTSSFSAGANSINLLTNGSSNDFTGAVTLSNSGANNVSLNNNAALILAASTVGQNLTITANGAISQTGALTVPGTSSFSAGANTINLSTNGSSNDFTGAVSLSNSGANNVSLTNSIALALGTSSVGSGTLSLTSGGSITETGAITQAASAGTVTIASTAASSDVILNTQANNFSGAITFGGTLADIRDVDLRNINSSAALPTNLASLTNLRNLAIQFDNAAITFSALTLHSGGSLSAIAGGAISQTGALTVPGTSSFNAGAHSINLLTNGGSNDFVGAVTLSNSGANAVSLNNNAALILAASTVGQNLTITANGAISQTGALTVPGTSSFSAGANSINLLTNGGSNDFTGAVTLSNSGANNVSLNNNAALVLAASTIGQNLTITSSGAISQTGALTVPGTSSFSAGANSINLLTNGGSNDFTGAVTLSNSGANNVSLNNNAALILAASTVGQNLTITANGAISQTGALTVPGTSSFSAGAHSINLLTNGSSNNFTGAVTLSNSGANNVSLNNNAALILAASTVGQNLTIAANGAISQTGALTVPGTSSFSAGANSINLLTNGSSNSFTGAVSLSNSGANAVSLNNNRALVLAASTVGQNLTITANGAISQTGALTVPGTSSFSAGANSINLLTNGGSNDFTGAVALSNSGANNVSLNNNAALVLAASTVGQNLAITANGAISQTGALTVPGTSSFIAGANSINLLTNGNSNSFTGAVTLSNSGANAVSLNNNRALVLAASTVGQNLTITANGAISQTGALTVPGTSSFSAGANTINLLTNGSSNDFTGAVTLSNSGANNVSLNNNAGLILGTVNVGQNLTLTANGAISQTGTINSALLTTTSSGGTVLNGANTVTSFNATNTSSGNISLTNTASPLTITGISQSGGGNVSVTNTGAITTSGAITGGTGTVALNASGALTINQAISTTNNNISLTGSGLSIAATDTVNAGSGNLLVNSGTGTLTLNLDSLLLSTNQITLTGDLMVFNLLSQIGGSGSGTGLANNVIIQPNTAGTAIGIAGGSGLQLSTIDLGTIRASNVQIGNSSAGNISIAAAWTPVATFAENGVLTFDTAGTVTQAGILNLATSGSSLLFRNASSVTLLGSNIFNSNIAANINGPLSILSVGTSPVTVSSLTDSNGTVNGITATSATINATLAGIVLNSAITTSGTGDSIVLAGLTFTNNAGASALNPTAGNFLVWSGNPANDNRGGIAYNFKQYNAIYGVTSVLGTGNGFLYTIAPVITPSLTGTVTKSYDATTAATLAANNYTSSGAIDGDTITLNNPTSGTYATANAGTNINVAVSGVAIANATNGLATVYGYQISPTSLNSNIGTITPALLTISSNAGQTKVYGTNDPTSAETAYSITSGTLFGTNQLIGDMGRVAGETVGSYNFTQNTISVSDGNSGNNYSITFNGITNPFTITARPLTASISNQTKTYGTNDPTLSGIAVILGNVVNSSVTDINGNVTTINDTGKVATTLASLTRAAGENVGNYAINNATFNSLTGSAASNYSLGSGLTGSPMLSIGQATLTASIANQSKVYGTSDPSLSGINVILNGLIDTSVTNWMGTVTPINDTGNVATTLASLTRQAGENVGSYNVLASALNNLTGSAASNYFNVSSLSGTPSLSITQATLTADITNQTKVYGTNDPSLSGINVILNGIVDTSVTNWMGTVTPINDIGNVATTLASLTRQAGENVGTYNVLTSALNNLTGSAASNYFNVSSLSGTPSLSITPATLTASIANQTKVYGTNDPSLTGINVILNGLIDTSVTNWMGTVTPINDTGNVATTLASLTRQVGESVGSYNVLTSALNNLTGSAASNYFNVSSLSGTPSLSITQATLTASIANQTKVYGTNDPSLSGINVILNGLVDTSVTNWMGTVTPINDTGNVATTLASLTRQAGENVGSYNVLASALNNLTGSAASNYFNVSSLSGTPSLSITQATLTADITNQTKVYGTNDPSLSSINVILNGIVDTSVTNWMGTVTPINDTGNVAATLASLTRQVGENVGSYNILTSALNNLTGSAASNYFNVSSLSGTPSLSITPATLTASIANQTKVYGTNDPSLSGINVILNGIVDGTISTWNGNVSVNDTGNVAATLASLSRQAGENVGSYNILASALNNLTGSAASNYFNVASLSGTPSLSITPATLTADIANQNKIYGTNDPSLSSINVILNGIVDGTISTWNGNVSINDTGNVAATLASLTRQAGENVGTYNVLTSALNNLTGSAASNYFNVSSLSGTPSLSITPATLTASIANQTKVYGTDDPSLSGINVILNGIVDGTISTWNGNVSVNDTGNVAATLASLTRQVGENVGSYNVLTSALNNLTGSAASNYFNVSSLSGTPSLSITPATLTADIANQTKVYGTNDPSLSGINVILNGIVDTTISTWNGNVSVNDTGNVAATLASLTRQVGENVGTYNILASALNNLIGSAAANYFNVSSLSGTPSLSITPATLTADIANQTKVYGTSDPSLAGINVILNGIVDGTISTWNGNVSINDTGNVAATLASLTRQVGENVGSYNVLASALNSLTGSAASNYFNVSSLSGTPSLSITPATLTADIANQTKVYGTSDPSLSGINVILNGIVDGTISTWNGNVSVNDTGNVAATLASLTRQVGENVGTYNVLTSSLNNLTGSAAANYFNVSSLSGTPSLSITPATLTASIANQTKVYGTDDPSLTGINVILNGIVDGTISTWNGNVSVNDTGNVATTLASLTRQAGETVGAYNVLTSALNHLIGSAAANYFNVNSLSGTPSLNITPATLTASIANQTKVYGTNDPSLTSINVILNGIVDTSVTNWMGTVTPINDTGNVAATLASLTRQVGENVGSYNILASALNNLIGSAAANYFNVSSLSGTPSLTITPASLSASIANQTKVYGTDDPSISGISILLSGVVDTSVTNWMGTVTPIDDIGHINGTLISLTRDAGENVGSYAITSSLLSLSGSAQANYSNISTISGSPLLTITQASLTASIADQTKVYGTSDPAASSINVMLGGVVDGTISTWNGNVNINDTGNVVSTLASYTRQPGETVLGGPYLILSEVFNSLTGSASNNYLSPTTLLGNPTLSITPATLIASLTGSVGKVYDANTEAALAANNYQLSGIVGSDDVVLNDPTSGIFNNANVGANKEISVSGLTISGTAASNYQLASSTINNTIGTITPASLTISNISANNKTYNGSTNATLNLSNAILSGIYSGDVVIVNPNNYQANFVTAKAGNNISVLVNLILIGGSAGNYILIDPTDLTANIIATPTPATNNVSVSSIMQQGTTQPIAPYLIYKPSNTNQLINMSLFKDYNPFCTSVHVLNNGLYFGSESCAK